MRAARLPAAGDDRDAVSRSADGLDHDESDSGSGGPEDRRRFFFGLGSKAAGWGFLLAVIAAVIGANALLGHWSKNGRPHEAGSGVGVGADGAGPVQPDGRQAASVAQREFGELSGGGWAQAWQLWSDSARSALSQAQFVRLNSECRPALGVPYVIDSTTAIDATTVAVAWHQGTVTSGVSGSAAGSPSGSATGSVSGNATVVYENGAWHFVPDAQTLADYRHGVDRLIADRKAAGLCR